ncbi:glycosyltransferase involved in cell wall biosynthesis [Planktotalea frisia]|jgi:glycosyltransferase involved in cell wall biosynthesis|uniref:D-inositol 3-phosphate glycosyltransferase n=1 Tax=Planktotalea frisia TaxID=696762 RepID=A0A1L9NX05_9RHOB|nr:glycosyltransferase [Planktotalea frisia]OJI93828.1 D-inositol 3-phosphate glycosyltransferase [Planktotalea frisia]PZX30873.1 glycosyltransferase involved in cell wall biosynthesis [Planktotalea frisia]
MQILIIHQNFPGQYKHLAPALVEQGHQVFSLTPKVEKRTVWKGVQLLPYKISRASSKEIHPWLADLETKVIRADACYRQALAWKEKGLNPDVILAHHGWGEPMFLKDVWPDAKMGIYCELYHLDSGESVNFDPEFETKDLRSNALRLRLRNLNNTLHFEAADAGISPTEFQASTFPEPFRSDISVIHDGIDTELVKPNPDAVLKISDDLSLTRDDEVITFINRNLEPYRGYHAFMRALPKLLKARPNAQVVLLGGDEVSYGSKPPAGKTWKQIYIDEVRDQISDEDWARVHYLGRVPYDTFLAMMQVSRLHIYLTYPFVLSWSLLEAMSAEAAILASDTAPVLEAIRDDETGMLTDFFDGDALVEKANALLEDPDKRARLGKAAREFVLKTYDLKTHCLPTQLEWVAKLTAK